MDEQNHLARGLAFLRTGDARLSLEHPPLVNTISALPLLTLRSVRLPTDHPSWEHPEGWYTFAELLLWRYNHDVTRMIFLARLPIVFLTIGLALVGYQFANNLWGNPAGLLALYFLLFDPNILAHGRYTTTDLGGATFVFLAALLLWRMWQSCDWSIRHLLLASLGLGLAFGSKLSTLAFVPFFALLAILPLYSDQPTVHNAGRRFLQLGVSGLLALLVVWAIFGFQWGKLMFRSPQLEALNNVQAPMPTFWAGIEQILLLSSGGGRPSFLLGETSMDGFAAYFPVAFLTKTPLATLILLAMALPYMILPSSPAWQRKRALFILLPTALYFGLSLQSELNIGYRHLLPMLPFLYVLIAGMLSSINYKATGIRHANATDLRSKLLIIGPYAVAFSLLASSLLIHPHYLSYFNVLVGGPTNGYEILVDSNVDWGQDLLRLKDWMAENDVEQLKLSWFGTADPSYYGIRYEPLPGLPRHFDLWFQRPPNSTAPEPGVYAISASNLWELPLQDEKYVFPWFRARRPDARVGYSILIYEVH